MTKRIILYLTGIFICSFGIALVIKASVGVGPWDAVYIALFKKIGFTVGTWAFCFQILFILLAVLLEKKKPDGRIFISSFIGAVFLDISLLVLLSPFSIETFTLFIRWFFFALGLFLLAFGIRTYVSSGFPKTPEDEIMFAVANRLSISFGLSILIIDGTGLILAFLLKGPIGIGTLLSPILLAIFIKILLRVDKKEE